MATLEKQENLEEILKNIEKELKKKKEISQEELNKIMQEANENVEFLKVLDEIETSNTGKKVIFVDGKACLVYDAGSFYVEDSVDSKKLKKKLTKQQAKELYVEYFFRYIMNPAIEAKRLRGEIQKVAVKTKTPKVKSQPKKEATKVIAKKEIKTPKKNEEMVR